MKLLKSLAYCASIILCSAYIVTDVQNNEHQEYKYRLAVLDGYAALYSYGKDELIETYDIYAYSLPQTDRESLEAGMMIKNEQQLNSLLEDFDG